MKRSAATTPAAPIEAAGHQTLSAYIQARFDEFSRSQKDVAQYIVDHLDEVAFQTAEELARRANTSSLDGRALLAGARLRGLPRAPGPAREEYRRRVAAGLIGGRRRRRPSRSSRSTRASSRPPWPPTTSTSRRPRARSRARTSSPPSTRSPARERVLIAGTDQMAFFASYLRHLLMLLDLQADIVASPSQEALSRLGRIDDATLVIGLSAGRPHPLVVRAMKLARHRKARDASRSPTRRCREVAKLAQIRLYYSSNSPGLRALAHRAAVDDPGAGIRCVQPRRRAVRRSDQSFPPEVEPRRLAAL